MGRTGDMTTGRPVRLILEFAIPLFIGNIFQQIYSIVDTMIAGYNLGDNAIAAIGATSSLYSLMINFASGLNSGYGIVLSRAFGAKDQEGFKRSVAAAVVLNTTVTAALTVLSLVFLRLLMGVLNVPDGIFEEAYGYISIILGGMITTILYNMFAGILRAMGNSRTPLYFLILSCTVNLSLDMLFVAVFRWGVQGAAAATVIAQGVSALCAGSYVVRRYRDMLPKKEHFHLEIPILREMAASGFAMAVMLCVVDIGSVIYQRSINSLGELLIVAHTAARRLIGIFMMPLSSIAAPYSTFTGQNWGAGKKERIRHSLIQTMAMEAGWGIFSFLMIVCFGSMAVQLLTNTSDLSVIQNAQLSLRIHFACFPALGILLALRTALQAMGRKLVPVISSTFELAIKVIAGLWLIPEFGYLCVCLTEPVIWVVCMLFLIAVFIVKKPVGGT